MEWKIALHSEDKYIEIVTAGVADRDGSMEMAKVISSSMRKNKYTRALIDHRNIESVSGETMDIYERPNLFRFIGVILGVKIAEIINPEHRAHFRFLETVCRNRGFLFSIFYDKSAALDWLLHK
jgi:hypothetical protein